VSELSELCDTLATEKAEAIRQVDTLAGQVAELEREKAALVEKLGDLTRERDYLRQALAAALTRPLQLPEKAESLTPRPVVAASVGVETPCPRGRYQEE